MIAFEKLGCTDAVRQACAAASAQAGVELDPGRVTSLDRGYPLVNLAAGELRAEPAAAIKKSEDSSIAVGDWVACRLPQGHGFAIIEAVLPRSVEIARIKRVGREGQTRRQVLAANADVVLVCQSLTGAGLDVRLAVRQMAAVMGCGAQAAFVLTKCDVAAESVRCEAVAQLRAIAPEVSVLCVAAKPEGADDDARTHRSGTSGHVSKYAKKKAAAYAAQAGADSGAAGSDRAEATRAEAPLAGIEDVRKLVPAGVTALLLGESGVGKSSLVNALLGADTLQTGAVRATDDRGRHTTVARRIVEVPGGGLVIDAPGLRTLQIIDLEASLHRTFPDIVSLATACRFSDCTHTHEPGCAVRDAVGATRLAAYVQLCEESKTVRGTPSPF